MCLQNETDICAVLTQLTPALRGTPRASVARQTAMTCEDDLFKLYSNGCMTKYSYPGNVNVIAIQCALSLIVSLFCLYSSNTRQRRTCTTSSENGDP